MSGAIDPKIRYMAERHIAAGPNTRSAKALHIMLEKGYVTTDDMAAIGYRHAPRAIADARDAGIPIVTGSARSSDGGTMASYSFGAAADIQNDRLGGRSVLPKAFKKALLERYGSADCLTGAALPASVLQIDHRVSYRVAGDAGLADGDVEAYMLLDRSSQRSKSWSCENCQNFRVRREAAICKTCFWAYPEDYAHIAMVDIRRTDIVWQDADVAVHDRLKIQSRLAGVALGELLRQMARNAVKE